MQQNLILVLKKYLCSMWLKKHARESAQVKIKREFAFIFALCDCLVRMSSKMNQLLQTTVAENEMYPSKRQKKKCPI